MINITKNKKGTMLLLQGQMKIQIQYKQMQTGSSLIQNTNTLNQYKQSKWNAMQWPWYQTDRQSPEALSIKDEPLPPRWRERQQRGGLWVSFADRGILAEPHWAECRGHISLLLMRCCVSVQREGFAAILKKRLYDSVVLI